MNVLPLIAGLVGLAGAPPPTDAETAALQAWADTTIRYALEPCSPLAVALMAQAFTISFHVEAGEVSSLTMSDSGPDSLTECFTDAVRASARPPRLNGPVVVEVPVILEDPPPVPGPGEPYAELRKFTLTRGRSKDPKGLQLWVLGKVNPCVLRAARIEPAGRDVLSIALSADKNGVLSEPRFLRAPAASTLRSCIASALRGVPVPNHQNFRAAATFELHPAAPVETP